MSSPHILCFPCDDCLTQGQTFVILFRSLSLLLFYCCPLPWSSCCMLLTPFYAQIAMTKCGLWHFSMNAPTPQEILTKDSNTQSGDTSIDANRKDCAENFAIVTAASYQYYDRLVNLIGSVHVWARTRSVLAYDIGLTAVQVRKHLLPQLTDRNLCLWSRMEE